MAGTGDGRGAAATRDLEAFTRYLRDHNLPVTAQRLAVAEVVLGSAAHLSADEVARELARRGQPVGTATVYRALEVLLRSGLAVERDFGSSRAGCGRVVEFRDERLERMTSIMAEQHGFVRQRHRLVIYGVCAECRG